MNEWLNSVSPFKRAEKEMVSVEIKTVLAQTTNTWQVDWLKTTRDRQGVAKESPKNMRALITIYTAENTPQTTEEQIRLNPLGIYIRDFSWSALQ
jgi:type IV secretion system protein TrbF